MPGQAPRRLSLAIIVVALTCALGWANTAAAQVTLGSAVQPSGSAPSQCFSQVFVQPTYNPLVPYTVPAGGGALTAWQTTTNAAWAGQQLTLLVLAPGTMSSTTASSFTVVGSDTETLPSISGVASFTISPALAVQAGDVLGLDSPSGNPYCAFHGGTTPSNNSVFTSATLSSLPTNGTAVSATASSGYILDAAATLDNDVDAGVTAGASPGAVVGRLAELTATVTNGGPAVAPITFIDTVPPGLQIDSAVSGAGSCAVNGQSVTCTLSALGVGQSAPVAIIVTPVAAGRYADTAVVATGGVNDPNAANNTAGATLTVGHGGPSECQVPPLAGTTVKLARSLLKLLDCRAGRTVHAPSRSVAKGLVAGTKPGAGRTAAAGTRVTLVVSSGRPKHARRR